MYYLPWWMQWMQAVGVGLISILGAWIALRQARIAGAKLNLDLYDRRYKVFEAARTYLQHFSDEAKVTMEQINVFILATGDAVFLFDKDVPTFLEELTDFGLQHRQSRMQLKGTINRAEDSEFRASVHGEIEAYAEEFRTLYPRLIEVFKPYLKLGNI